MLGPKIAVVVPVFNVSPYIADCLNSILAQTYKNFDLIAVDDCSTDDSLQILKTYQQKDNRIIILQHKNNLACILQVPNQTSAVRQLMAAD